MAQKCILCHSSPVIQLEFIKSSSTPGTRQFLRCPVCDLIFVPEIFHLPPPDEAARYKLHKNTLSNEGYVGMFLEKIELIRQYCPGVYSILDYGCGPEPVLAELMRRAGFDCDIYDPHFFPLLHKGPFDLVISTEVFEHFRDIRAELYKIQSLLAPGGFLAIMTSFHDQVGDFKEWLYITDPTHICFFGMLTFKWIAKEFGFKIIYTDRRNFIILQQV